MSSLSKRLKLLLVNFNLEKSCFEAKTAAEEHNKRFVLNIPKNEGWECCRIHVDNCLIKYKDIKMKKCDYWFHISEKSTNPIKDNYNIFVEFKGEDIKQAYKQVISAIELIKPKIGFDYSKCYGVIVSSNNKLPKEDQTTQKLKTEFKAKRYGKKLEIQSREMAFKLP